MGSEIGLNKVSIKCILLIIQSKSFTNIIAYKEHREIKRLT